MAENPQTWSEAERIVDRVLTDHAENMRRPDPLIGLSVVRQITDALRRAGLLRESAGS